VFKKKNILAIVPARGGSKGIKLKNLKKIHNKSLVEIVAKVVKKTKEIDFALISTDNNKIAIEAQKHGLKYIFKRPKYLSGDFVSDHQVVKHALLKAEKFINKKFDIVLLLQPTSPSRRSYDIRKCLKILIEKKVDSVWTCTKIDKKFHPLKVLQKNSKGGIKFFNNKGSQIIARQQLGDVMIRNGICYAVLRKVILKHNNLLGLKCKPLEIKRNVVNIDTLEDLINARKVTI